MLQTLRDHFGFDAFREGQETVIRAGRGAAMPEISSLDAMRQPPSADIGDPDGLLRVSWSHLQELIAIDAFISRPYVLTFPKFQNIVPFVPTIDESLKIKTPKAYSVLVKPRKFAHNALRFAPAS